MLNDRGWGAAFCLAVVACVPTGQYVYEGSEQRLEPDVTCRYGAADCNPAIDDVIGQVTTLSTRGEPLGFHLGVLAAPTRDRHWQSIQRLPGSSHYMVVTRSTDRPEDADVGVVHLASADGAGRMRSNRLGALGDAPPSEDAGIIAIASQTDHTHAGGTQLAGQVLAVPLEAGLPGSQVELFDLGNPERPRSIGIVDHVVPEGASSQAGSVALAKLADGSFLMVIGRRDARTLDFYRSTSRELRTTTWKFADSWSADELQTTIADENYGDYQNLQLLAGTDRRLYLVGTHEDGVINRTQWIDLFALEGIDEMSLVKVGKRRVSCARVRVQCNLDAGAGIYIDPTGALIVYGIEHAADGPAGSVKMMEF